MTIHAFGAFYGLAASLVLSKPGSGSSHAKNGATYTSDITAMIGTIFLWIFWVSSALATCARGLAAPGAVAAAMEPAQNTTCCAVLTQGLLLHSVQHVNTALAAQSSSGTCQSQLATTTGIHAMQPIHKRCPLPCSLASMARWPRTPAFPPPQRSSTAS